MIKKNEQGTALIIAISITVILILVSFLMFSLTHSGITLQREERENFLQEVLVHRAFQDILQNNGLNFTYNLNTIPASVTNSLFTLSDGTPYTVSISNSHTQDLDRFDSFVIPESGYTQRIINYYVTFTLGDFERSMTVRVPSDTQISLDHANNKSTISLNVPAINFHKLLNGQLSSGTLNETQTGFIGTVSINNSNYELTYTDSNGTAQTPISLGNNFNNSGTFSLSQGWSLVDGNWNISIGVYDTSSDNDGCIIIATLNDFLTNFSGLTCTNLEEGGEDPYTAEYPNPEKNGVIACVENQRYRQNQDEKCEEDGVIFEANSNRAFGLPFNSNNSRRWRIYYPADYSNKPAPFTEEARYNSGDLVVYDHKEFINTTNNQTQSPFNNTRWNIKGVFEWDERVYYNSGDVVIYNGGFYESDRNNRGSNQSPANTNRWTYLGTTYDDKSPSEFPEYNIKFDRKYETQHDLNCYGEYPPIDTNTYSQCIDGESYNIGDECFENNMLFEAVFSTSSSPYHDPAAWRLAIPNSDWVIPYSDNVTYANNTKVIYDKRRFVSSGTIGVGQNPYENTNWLLDGVYNWDTNIQYSQGEVVIEGSNFYRSTQNNNIGILPSSNPAYWQDEGDKINGQETSDVVASCGVLDDSGNNAEPIELDEDLQQTGGFEYINLMNLPNDFTHYGENDPTSVTYELSGSFFDQVTYMYVTGENGWELKTNPASQGTTLIREFNGDNAAMFFYIPNINPGGYVLNVN